MKYLIKSQIAVLGLILVFLASGIMSSCTKKYEEINTNPNNPVDVPAINTFTHSEEASIARQMGGWIQHTYLGVWCQQWCKCQYIDEDRYMPRDMSGEFQAPYINELKNLTIVISKATANNETSLAAAGKVMRAWVFLYLTDVWGDIPYSEALQGFDVNGTLTPKYDTQASIYADLLSQLEEANVALTGTTVNFGSGDLIYGGDPVKWRKLANSLKLRMLNRAAGTPWTFTYNMAGGTQVTTTPGAAALADADTRIAAILGSPDTYPVFTSNDDNAQLAFPGLPYRNPIFDALYSRTDQGISETMVNWLKARNDPRLYVYAQPTPNSVTTPPLAFVGFQNGRGITIAPFPDVSILGTKVAYDENAPLYLMTYDEVEFTIAEYNMRKANDAAAQAAYEAGITASMERWGLTDNSTVYPSWGKQYSITTGSTGYPVNYTAYFTNPLVAWGGTDAEKFQKICEQRWAAIFGEGVQAYSEIRRTGFPERIFEYQLEGDYYPGLGLPIRLQYALTEDTYNTANVAAARVAQKIEAINEGMFSTNGIQSQVWWHTRKNPIPTVTNVL
jgi:hypothetical protein